MINCKSCNALMPESDRFCQNCGAANELPAVVAADEAVQTPPIDTQMQGNVQSYDFSQVAPVPASRRSAALTNAIVGIIVSAVLFLILYFTGYVVVAAAGVLFPISSFTSIKKDKERGITKFTLAIVLNIIALILTAINLFVYFGAL